MPASITDCTTLNNGLEMPWLGLGVYKTPPGQDTELAVRAAIDIGYRHIDTAKLYENEEGVGKAVRGSGVRREDIFVTTKLWNDDQGYDNALRAFDTSLKRLGLDYIDLYLIHWPGSDQQRLRDTWKAFEQIYKDGRAKAIGVSNFNIHHLENILAASDVVPTVNQVECHPHQSQVELREYCKEKGIQLEAWAPLMRGRVLDDPTILKIAAHHGKTAAQVILRWHLEHEVVIIPKSVHAERIRENANIFDFSLSDSEVATIDALNDGTRTGPDPDAVTF